MFQSSLDDTEINKDEDNSETNASAPDDGDEEGVTGAMKRTRRSNHY